MKEPRNPWEQIAVRVAYENPWIRVEHHDVVRPDGEPGIYGLVRFRNAAVGTVALDAANRVLLVGQWRYALGRYSWEIPEGGVPLGASLVEGAQRELAEETGYRAAEWRVLVRFALSNSVTDEEGAIFLARGLESGEATPEPTEELAIRWVPLAEAVAMVDRGEITDAISQLGLFRVALELSRAEDPERSDTAEVSPHDVFAPKVADYVASRPDYPAALFDRLEEIGALRPDAVVADVGAGTGLLTGDLLPRCASVVAVEPNARMRAAAEARLGGWTGFRSVDGSAEATTLADGSVDLVTVAQAYHWFDVRATRREFRRILRSDGLVALIRNDRVLTDPVHAALDEIFVEYGGPGREAVIAREKHAAAPDFFGGPPQHSWELPHEQRLSGDGFLALAFSRSYMPPRDAAAGREAARRVSAVFDAFASGGEVTVRYLTVAFVGRPG